MPFNQLNNAIKIIYMIDAEKFNYPHQLADLVCIKVLNL